MIDEKLYTPAEVQKIMRRKNVRSVYRYIDSGKLIATKIQNRFYIKEKDLREFLNYPEEEENR